MNDDEPQPTDLCPDRGWCIANHVCYWNCHADAGSLDDDFPDQRLPPSATNVGSVVGALSRTDEMLIDLPPQAGDQWGRFFQRSIKTHYAIALVAAFTVVVGVGSLAFSMRRPISAPAPAPAPAPIVKDQQSVAETKSDPIRVIPIYRVLPMPAPAPAVETPKPAAAPAPMPPPAKPVAAAEPEPAPDEPEPPIKRHWHEGYRRHGDICAAHGLRKVTTHNGRSWRCR